MKLAKFPLRGLPAFYRPSKKVWFSIGSAVLFIGFAHPFHADEPKVCVGGRDDGKSCPPTICAAPGQCTANDVRAYANGCYDRLQIKKLAGPFQCKDTSAHQLVVTIDGVIKDIHCPKDKGNDPTPAYKPCQADAQGLNANRANAFPIECDNPAWLPNRLGQCYGNSYIQELTGITAKNGGPSSSVRGALLCRHKRAWSDGDKDFPDIAMVIHNSESGETCWFQTDDGACRPNKCSNDPARLCTSDSDCKSPGVCVSTEARCDGTNIPAPDTQAAPDFWLSPSRAANITCVRCHDNGPFMNSRWMYNTIELNDDGGKYVNNGFGFSTAASATQPAWLTPTFVTVGRAGLAKTDDNASECTRCHKIHAQAQIPNENAPFSSDFGGGYATFQKWLDFVTGSVTPKQAKFTATASRAGTGFKIAYWMPAEHSYTTADAWKKVYEKHIDKLRACMSATDEDRNLAPDDPHKTISECQNERIALNDNPNHLMPGAGARLYASLDHGQTYPDALSFGVAWPPHNGAPISITAGTSPVVAWEADPNFTVCSIVATFPTGVVSPRHVGTASNWSLPDQQVDVGELTKPGQYRFDIRCDLKQNNPEQGDHVQAASLTFEIAEQPEPPTNLRAVPQ